MVPIEITRMLSEAGYTMGVSSDGGFNLLATITAEIAKKNPKIAHKKGQLEQVGRGIPYRTYHQLKSVSATNKEWAQRLIEFALGHSSALQSGHEMRLAALEAEIKQLRSQGDSNPVILPAEQAATALPEFDLESDQQLEQDELDQALTEQTEDLEAKASEVEKEVMAATAELEDAEDEAAVEEETEHVAEQETVPPDSSEWEEIGDKGEG